MSFGNTGLNAATSSPVQNRLIFSYFQNGQCIIEVQDCYDVGALTYEINGEATEVLCTNLETGKNEVVAIIDTGSTNKATFDLSRFLPADKLSRFFQLVRENCGLRIYLARGDDCVNPFDINEFDVLGMFGSVVTFGAYNRTELRHKNKADTAAIMESTTVTAFDFREVAKQTLTIRGGLTVAPIVDIVLCDNKACGAKCDDDSDGCQRWIWTDASGLVGWTENQWFSENQSVTTPAPLVNVKRLCCVNGQLILIGEDAEGNGAIATASLTDVFAGDPIAYTVIETTVAGADLAVLEGCSVCGNTLWLFGETGNTYQYNPNLGTIVSAPTTAGLANTWLDMAAMGDTVVLVGESGQIVRSQDGGTTFSLIEVIDPTTGLVFAGNLHSVEVLDGQNYMVGTEDGRVLFTLDDGATWNSQLIESTFGNVGTIEDISFDPNTQVGYMVTNGPNGSAWFKTYYGNCSSWLMLPESSDTLSSDYIYNATKVCPDDPNVAVAVGDNGAGAGVIVVATADMV